MCVEIPANDIFVETMAQYYAATKWFITGYLWNSSPLHWRYTIIAI